MPARWLLTLTLAALFVIQGCSKTPPSPVDPLAPAMVEVENQSFYDMNVYVIRGGMRARLGTVSGNTRAGFEIPRTLVSQGSQLRFQADPIGGGRDAEGGELSRVCSGPQASPGSLLLPAFTKGRVFM